MIESGVNFKALAVKGMVYRKPEIEEKTVPPGDVQVIYFDQSSYDLRNDNKPPLDVIAGSLQKHPDWKIRITGYTDNVGPRQPNMVYRNTGPGLWPVTCVCGDSGAADGGHLERTRQSRCAQ